MNIVERVTNILTKPAPEWQQIAVEPGTPVSILTNYAAILAAVPAVINILVAFLPGGWGPIGGLFFALFSYVIGLGILFGASIVANMLAPSFGGTASETGGMKLVAYAATPIWLASAVAALLRVVPFLGLVLGGLIGLAGVAYGAYLLYLGCQSVMRVPTDKAPIYTLAVIGIWVVAYAIITSILFVVVGILFAAGAVATGGALLR